MDLVQLKYFLAVAEHGSISAAARALDARQPTLSVSLKNLEEDLGSTLFHRDLRGVALTASGRLLKQTAEEIFERLDAVRSEITGLEAEDVGQFTVGCPEAVAAYFLPAFMKEFLTASPRIQVTLWSGTREEIKAAILERRLDFGLAVNPEPHDDLVMVPLFRDGIVAYVAASTPAPRTVIDAYVRLKTGPLIVSRRASQVADLIARFQADDVLPDRVLECGDLQLVRSLAKEGLGVALLPRRVARHGTPDDLRPLHPMLPGVHEVVQLIYRGDMHRTRAALRLKDALAQYGRSLQVSDPGEKSILPP